MRTKVLISCFIIFSLLVLPALSQETYNIKVICNGTDWFKVIVMEIGNEDVIVGSSIALISTLLPIHNFSLNTDFFVNGGELSYSRVPWGPTNAQVNFDANVNSQLQIACMKGSLGTLTIQVWQNFVLQEEYVNDETGYWCFRDWTFYSTVGIEPSTDPQPEGDLLDQNYPNPFNPATTISFTLPVPGRLILGVYDISGRLVAKLVNGWREVGKHEVTFDASDLNSGVYFYSLRAGDYSAVKKMVLVK
jgi:hypothetical protein